MTKTFLFASLITAACSISCKTTQHVQLNSVQDKEVVELKKGETYKLSVKENPSTGHSWITTTSENCSVEITPSFKRDNQPKMMVGVGGVKTFSITALQSGECSVLFEHRRPGGGSIESKTIVFKVKP